MRIEDVAVPSNWNDLLDRAPDGTPSHRCEFLDLTAEYSDTRLHPYVGYRGKEPVGLFPVFELRKGPFASAFSPPPDLKIPYLGPLLLPPDNMKRRKREQRNRRFVSAVLGRVDRDVGPRFLNVRTSPAYGDERPFLWNGCEGTIRHTYVVDLTRDEEDMLAALGQDARRNVSTDVSYEVAEGDVADVDPILDAVEDRYASQGIDFSLSHSFVTDLFHRLPDGAIRAYVCRQEETFLGGDVVLECGDTIYGWLGAVDLDADLPVSDFLYWHVFMDAKRRGRTSYDMVGANDCRLSSYKAKFGPTLRSYATVQQTTLDGQLASTLYRAIF